MPQSERGLCAFWITAVNINKMVMRILYVFVPEKLRQDPEEERKGILVVSYLLVWIIFCPLYGIFLFLSHEPMSLAVINLIVVFYYSIGLLALLRYTSHLKLTTGLLVIYTNLSVLILSVVYPHQFGNSLLPNS